MFDRWNTQRTRMELWVWEPDASHARGGGRADRRDRRLSSESHLIVAGLLDCRSQHHVIIDDPADTERWQRIASRECAVIAWPPRTPDQPMLRDVFEGLP